MDDRTDRIVTLDNDPASRAEFSLQSLEVAARADSRSGEAARAALSVYRDELGGGASATVAASVAGRVLRASLRG